MLFHSATCMHLWAGRLQQRRFESIRLVPNNLRGKINPCVCLIIFYKISEPRNIDIYIYSIWLVLCLYVHKHMHKQTTHTCSSSVLRALCRYFMRWRSCCLNTWPTVDDRQRLYGLPSCCVCERRTYRVRVSAMQSIAPRIVFLSTTSTFKWTLYYIISAMRWRRTPWMVQRVDLSLRFLLCKSNRRLFA